MNENYKRVVDALPAATGDEYARPTAVAEALGMKLKTARDHLRNAVKAGHVEAAKDDDGLVIYRQAAGWDAPAADVEEPDAIPPTPVENVPDDEPDGILDPALSPDPFEPATPEDEAALVAYLTDPAQTVSEPSEPATPTEVPADGGSPASDELSAVLDGLQAARPGVTAALAEVQTAAAPVTGTCSHGGALDRCGKPVTKSGRSWVHDDSSLDAAHKATTRDPRRRTEGVRSTCSRCLGEVAKDGRYWKHVTAPATPHDATTAKLVERKGTQDRRFNPGALKNAVTSYLQARYTENPDRVYAIKDVADAVNATVSSTAYALDTLTSEGVVKVTSVKPYTYRAE